MKAIGIVRKLDDLGRICLPIEMRRNMDIAEGDSLEFFVEGDRIILRKYVPGCVFCGADSDLRVHKGKLVCSGCRAAMAVR